MANHRQRRPISDDELKVHLAEQIGFLNASAAAFDAGNTGEAKRMALTIRVLLHETKRSKSLLRQLNHKPAFVSTASPFDPRNLVSHMGLLAIQLGDAGVRYIPRGEHTPHKREVSFDEWWNEIVFKTQGHDAVSRKDLILTAANQDGGGHVDPELDEVYARLVKENSLGWLAGNGDKTEPMGDPTKAAIRQISAEVLMVLRPLLRP